METTRKALNRHLLGRRFGNGISEADISEVAADLCSGIVCIHDDCKRHSASGELYCGEHGGEPEYITDPGEQL